METRINYGKNAVHRKSAHTFACNETFPSGGKTDHDDADLDVIALRMVEKIMTIRIH